MSGRLSGQHALVTGAGSGIGAAAAAALAAEGASLTLVGRDRGRLEARAADLDGAIVAPADVTDEAAVEEAFQAAEAAHGPVDVLVANAGGAASAPLARTGLDDYRHLVDVNLTSLFLCSRRALPSMTGRGSGRIVAVASIAGLRGMPYVAVYCAAKHAVVGFVRALALEVARTGVTVNAVCPGYVDTPLVERAVAGIVAATGRSEGEAMQALVRTNPQGRLIQPEEVASAVAWLCLPEQSGVNGAAIPITGGEG